jgi:hypothetical protein
MQRTEREKDMKEGYGQHNEHIGHEGKMMTMGFACFEVERMLIARINTKQFWFFFWDRIEISRVNSFVAEPGCVQNWGIRVTGVCVCVCVCFVITTNPSHGSIQKRDNAGPHPNDTVRHVQIKMKIEDFPNSNHVRLQLDCRRNEHFPGIGIVIRKIVCTSFFLSLKTFISVRLRSRMNLYAEFNSIRKFSHKKNKHYVVVVVVVVVIVVCIPFSEIANIFFGALVAFARHYIGMQKFGALNRKRKDRKTNSKSLHVVIGKQSQSFGGAMM